MGRKRPRGGQRAKLARDGAAVARVEEPPRHPVVGLAVGGVIGSTAHRPGDDAGARPHKDAGSRRHAGDLDRRWPGADDQHAASGEGLGCAVVMRVTCVPGEDSGIRRQLRAPVVPHRDDDGVEPPYGVVLEPEAPAATLPGRQPLDTRAKADVLAQAEAVRVGAQGLGHLGVMREVAERRGPPGRMANRWRAH